jgi:aminoglycoside phosphotransferase family enzyme
MEVETNCIMTHLVESLQNPALYDPVPDEVRIVQTHMSWVVLANPYAYKIKKPVDLGFADFTTLQKRRHFCQEELRLNRRLAPELYLASARSKRKATASADCSCRSGYPVISSWQRGTRILLSRSS